jgi:hypothetical protein
VRSYAEPDAFTPLDGWESREYLTVAGPSSPAAGARSPNATVQAELARAEADQRRARVSSGR